MAHLTYEIPGKAPVAVPLYDLTLIGRALDCAVSLPDRMASRRHAEVRKVGGEFLLKDLKSKNGTLVNGNPVGSCKLQDGDAILIGLSQLVYRH